MFTFLGRLVRPVRPPKYYPLKHDDDVEFADIDDTQSEDILPSPTARRKRVVLVVLLIVGLICAVGIFTFVSSWSTRDNKQFASENQGGPITSSSPSPTVSGSSCPIRREWRTLFPTEQQHYISSVHCLSKLPSALKALANAPSSSLYEDFPYIHSHVGYATHHAAPFLPWHRYFLHLYHAELKNKCNYTGELVYWDWMQDWQDLTSAPVFNPGTGFGGDGDPNGEIVVGKTGRCVVDGPFADIRAQYYDVKYQPHCLSRGFRDDLGNLGVIGNGETVSPESIEEVMKLDNYDDFRLALEDKVHDTIPFGVGGDFETFTAPYDPLFYLHHTQLDRLWWIWQQRDPEKRLSAYGGHKQRHSMEMAQLTDKIRMSVFAPQIEIQSVMNTESDILCYKY